MNTAVAAIIVSLVVPLTGGLLWASNKYPKKYSKLVWNFWSVILLGCGATVALFSVSLVIDSVKLAEALEVGAHVAIYAKTVLTSLKFVGGAVFIAATGSAYFWAIGHIGKVLNEDDGEDTPTT